MITTTDKAPALCTGKSLQANGYRRITNWLRATQPSDTDLPLGISNIEWARREIEEHRRNGRITAITAIGQQFKGREIAIFTKPKNKSRSADG